MDTTNINTNTLDGNFSNARLELTHLQHNLLCVVTKVTDLYAENIEELVIPDTTIMQDTVHRCMKLAEDAQLMLEEIDELREQMDYVLKADEKSNEH